MVAKSPVGISTGINPSSGHDGQLPPGRSRLKVGSKPMGGGEEPWDVEIRMSIYVIIQGVDIVVDGFD